MRKPIKRVAQKQGAYEQNQFVGIIIYVNESENWCNVELSDGTILYRIAFHASNLRLRRIKQAVLVTQVVGKRQRYAITGEAHIRVASTAFNPLGFTKYDTAGAKWDNARPYQWM